MTAYLPTLHNLLGAVGLAITLVMFTALGAAVTGRRGLPEIQLVAGWGLACLVLTAWATVTPVTLAIPAALLGIVALAALPLRGFGPLRGVSRLLLLSVPLWLVMLPLRPSQPDTWLNLLPNAAYLFDFGMLPTDLRPPSYSLLPAAPYNTQFVAYIASMASGSFAEASMALFNVALLCASGMLFARILSDRADEPPWWACASGLLLSIFLDPGFVPRVSLAPYGETSQAVTAVMAVWLVARMIDDLAHGVLWPRALVPLGLILAAQINAKQSGIGLVAAIAVTALAVILAHSRLPRARGVLAFAVALIPAVVLYLIWRHFVLANFVAGELKPLPFADWNFAILPQIISNMVIEMFHKATFFLCAGCVLIAAVLVAKSRPWSSNMVLLAVTAGVIVTFNGFLLFTYIAHFPRPIAAQAHSYFRYAAQLSLVVMLALIVALRPVVLHAVDWPRYPRLAIIPSLVVLLLPLAVIPLLRFDLDVPQPTLWDLAHHAARYIEPHDKLALLVPGDVNESVSTMLGDVLMFTPPRRPQLDIKVATTADPATLNALTGAGYNLALVTCAPPNQAVMLRHTDQGWQTLESWPYPAYMAQHRFSSQLARAPLCAAPVPQPD